jgi:hypothetical protein
VRVELYRAFASREPAGAEPGPGEHRANREGASPATGVDELIASLVDTVDRSEEEALEATVEPPTETVHLTPRRPLIRKLRRARQLVGRDVAFYGVASVGLGIVIGLLASRGLP